MTKFLNDDWMVANKFIDSNIEEKRKEDVQQYGSATVKDLNLPDAVSVQGDQSCKDVLAILQKGGFDQVPVTDAKGKMLGLITTGNLLSKVSRGRAKPTAPVTEVMYKFNTKRQFQEITTDTKLADLSKFFEKNHAAFVTVREADNVPIVKQVVTKVDLLNFLFNKQ